MTSFYPIEQTALADAGPVPHNTSDSTFATVPLVPGVASYEDRHEPAALDIARDQRALPPPGQVEKAWLRRRRGPPLRGRRRSLPDDPQGTRQPGPALHHRDG